MTTLPGTPPSAEMEGGWTPKNTKAFITWFVPMLLSAMASIGALYFSYRSSIAASVTKERVEEVKQVQGVSAKKIESIEGVTDQTRGLVNGALTAKLRQNAAQALRIASLTKAPEDAKAAATAAADLLAHEKDVIKADKDAAERKPKE